MLLIKSDVNVDGKVMVKKRYFLTTESDGNIVLKQAVFRFLDEKELNDEVEGDEITRKDKGRECEPTCLSSRDTILSVSKANID